MTQYKVFNSRSGQDLGVFDADSPDRAIEACVRDAGYESVADMERQLEQPCELQAVPVYTVTYVKGE